MAFFAQRSFKNRRRKYGNLLFSVRASFVVFPCVYAASYGFVPQIALLGSRLDW